jgi:hypothetical protein
MYIEAQENSNGKISAGTCCQLESGFIQEIATEAALETSHNIWVDGTLREHNWCENETSCQVNCHELSAA